MSSKGDMIMCEANLKTIKRILREYTAYRLSKETGIVESTIGKWVRGETALENMSLKHAIILTDFAKGSEKMKKWEILDHLNLNGEKLEKIEDLRLYHMNYNRNMIVEEDESVDPYNNELIRFVLNVKGTVVEFVFNHFGKLSFYNILD